MIEFPTLVGKTVNDDYSDFANEPVKNGGGKQRFDYCRLLGRRASKSLPRIGWVTPEI